MFYLIHYFFQCSSCFTPSGVDRAPILGQPPPQKRKNSLIACYSNDVFAPSKKIHTTTLFLFCKKLRFGHSKAMKMEVKKTLCRTKVKVTCLRMINLFLTNRLYMLKLDTVNFVWCLKISPPFFFWFHPWLSPSSF